MLFGRRIRFSRNSIVAKIASVAVLIFASGLTGCNETIFSNNNVWTTPDQTARGLGPDDLHAGPPVRGGGSYGLVGGAARSGGGVYSSEADSEDAPQVATVSADDSKGDKPAADAYQLNFENADVQSVAKAVIGDLLKANYIVDPRVTGQVSLTSTIPVPRGRILSLLESALLPVNGVIVKENGLYRIAPNSDPGGLRNAEYQSAGEGYGVSVIGTKFVSAATIGRLLEEYGSRAGSVKVDQPANFVIVTGTAIERQAALDAARTVDVDWLKNNSVAILPLNNATPDQVIGEINRVLGTGEGGVSQDMLRMQPVSRLNAILAISKSRDLIDKVVIWAKRLDKQDYAALTFRTYRLKYAQAKNAASVLNDMFGGGGGRDNSGQSDKDQLAPGGNQNSASTVGSSPSQGGFTSSATPSGFTSPGQGSSSFGSSGTRPGLGSGTNGSGGSSGTFGAQKTDASFTDGSKTDSSDSSGSGSSSGSGGGPGRVHVTADAPSNTLFIYANKQTFPSIEHAILAIDRAPKQINIEVTIAEVTLTDELQYGVQVYLANGRFGGSITNTGSGPPGIPLTTLNPGVNLLIGAVANPRVVINALANITNVKVLSTPSLVVNDRQVATLQVGDQVPILSQQATSVVTTGAPVVNSVDYKDTGIITNVLPRINANGVVSLEIEQQISTVSNPGSDSNPNLTPTISQRRVRSTVSVPSGQTVLLAGLIQDRRSGTRNGLPFVSDVKFLNDLLTTHDNTVNRDELILFIHPKIVNNPEEAAQVSEEFRSRFQSLQPQIVTRKH
jgi:general secretion pathway protein D